MYFHITDLHLQTAYPRQMIVGRDWKVVLPSRWCQISYLPSSTATNCWYAFVGQLLSLNLWYSKYMYCVFEWGTVCLSVPMEKWMGNLVIRDRFCLEFFWKASIGKYWVIWYGYVKWVGFCSSQKKGDEFQRTAFCKRNLELVMQTSLK